MDELEVPGFTTALLKKLDIFRLDRTLCDIKLRAKDGETEAHKLVLMSSSPYFAMLYTPANQAAAQEETREHLFEDFSIEILTTVIKFIYTGKMYVNKETVDDIKSLLNLLKVESGVLECDRYISNGYMINTASSSKRVEINVAGGGESLKMTLKLKESEVEDSGLDLDEPSKKKRKYSPKKIRKTDNANSVTAKRSRARKPANPKRKAESKVSERNIVDDIQQIKQEILTEDPEAFNEIIQDSPVVNNSISETDTIENNKKSIEISDNDETYNNNSDTDNVEISDYEDKVKKQKFKVKSKGTIKGKRGRKPREKEKKGEKRNAVPPKEDGPKLPKKRRKKAFPCSQCPRVLSSYKRKVFHEFSKHGTPYDTSKYTMVPCKEEGCNYVAANRHNLDTHMKSRHGVARPHICEFCGKAFKLPNILATHLNIHTGKKIWKCEQCGECFNQQSGLDVHIRRHHMGEASWAELCHLCSEKFMLKSELAWHLYKAHKQPLPDNYKVYQCEYCSFMTKSAKDFERHENIHKGIKKHVCHICQKACSTKSELRRHVGFHGEKKYKCTFEGCSFACTDSIGLDKHIKLMHTHKDYKPYACPVCQYRTGVRGNVDKHIRTVHDLIVVTKHTVELKMKYPQFSSGDVISKDGHLVATAAERKALQNAPPVDKDGNLVGGLEGAIQAGLNDYSELKNDKLSQHRNKLPKQRPRYNTAAMSIGDIIPSVSVQSDISSAIVNFTQTTANTTVSTGNRDFAALSNFVYIHGDAVASMQSFGMPVEAQDLRLQAGTSGNQPEQPAMYSLGNADLFIPNKFEYQEQQ